MNNLASFLLIVLLTSLVTAQEAHITPLRADYLRDDVGLLDRVERKEIIGLLEQPGQKPLGRIYLDILDKLPPGLTIDQYAHKRLNERPRMANEKIDRILLVVALQSKAVRIETSRDVWPILSDEYCHQVNREIIIRKFKKGAYVAGIKAGIEALIKKLNSP